MKKYIITREVGRYNSFQGYSVQYPIGDRFQYFCKSGAIGATIKIWKTLKGAENYIKKMSILGNYVIERR